MVEYVPQTKADEQYPLLKVSSGDGAGDGVVKQPSTTVSPGWNVTCSPKRSWASRWPEIITACWMTGILLGISFLVMYVLTIGAIRKHSLVIVKCNNSKPASDVYFHEIIQSETHVPFILYSDYLSYMSFQYPFLQFNVFFLIDDSMQSASSHLGSKHNNLLTRLMPYHYPRDYMSNFETDVLELRDFQLKHENVNITIIPLSKYMAQTPLRYKWRIIPVSYLPFYARIFSVWRTGGVGMDLTSFSNKFSTHQHVDRRITTILQHHNEGIKPEAYIQALNVMEKEEETKIFAIFYDLVNHMLNETKSFFNRTFTQFATEKDYSSDKPLIRTHRNKRDVAMEAVKNNIKNSINDIEPIKFTLESETTVNLTDDTFQTSTASAISFNGTNSIKTDKTHYENKMRIKIDERLNITNQNYNMSNKVKPKPNNNSDVAKFVIFYDFSLLSDSIGTPYTISEPVQSYADKSLISSAYRHVRKPNKGPPNILSIDSNGFFVSASSHLHPFLGGIISAGCQRMSPRFAIEDTYLTQCGAMFKDDIYCNNIFLL